MLSCYTHGSFRAYIGLLVHVYLSDISPHSSTSVVLSSQVQAWHVFAVLTKP